MSSIHITDVEKIYGDVTALSGVSIDVDPGEFVVLLGPSGAGKSTLLRLINGLTEPTEGRIELGEVEGGGTQRGNRVGMVFQQHNTLPDVSAFGNALSGALSRTSLLDSLFRRYDRDDKLAALRALETVGLLNVADQPVGQMSGGQQQRVGIARALTQDPDILLADEPVSSLDPASAEEVMEYLRAAAADRDITTIASLHQINIARVFGERFVGLRDGEVVFDGTEAELTLETVERIYGKREIESVQEGEWEVAA
jgi:phosphonate transport system ATP-binding protein